VFGPPGYEVALLYIAGLLALSLVGPSPLSIDRYLSRQKQRLQGQEIVRDSSA